MKSELQKALETEFKTCSYSPRGGMGRYCLGVSLQGNIGLLIGCLIRVSTEKNKEILAEEVENMATDTLGRGTIVYWRNIIYSDIEPEYKAEERFQDRLDEEAFEASKKSEIK